MWGQPESEVWSVGSLARKRGVECGVSPKAKCGVWGQPESEVWSVGSLARKRGVECGVSPKAMCGMWGQPESDVWSVGSTFSRAVSRCLGAAMFGLAGLRVSSAVLHRVV